MTQDEDAFAALNDEEARIIPPDFSIKKIIGEDVDIKQIFSPENVEKAQQVIHTHTDNFLEWVIKDLAALEESYKKAMADIAGSTSEISTLARTAFVIKSQAGTFGYDLATHIAKSLDDFCSQHFKPSLEHMTVVRKHIDTLSVIFHKNIKGDGGTIGSELSQGLVRLIEKYKT